MKEADDELLKRLDAEIIAKGIELRTLIKLKNDILESRKKKKTPLPPK